MNYHSFLFIIACLLQVSSSLSKFFKIIYTDYFCHIMLEKVLHILYNSQKDKSLFTFSCTKPTKDYKTTTNRWIVISSEDKSGWKRQTIHYWMWSRWRASTWVNNNLIKSPILRKASTLDILFSSNDNIHKSSCGLCFSASDPLIKRF